MAYENNFKCNDKKVYYQILENFKNNIVDPIEKFSSINGSSIESENNKTINIDEEEKNEMENEKILVEKNEDKKTEKLSDNNININENINLQNMFDNSLNDMDYENGIKINTINKGISIEKRQTTLFNVKNDINEKKEKEKISKPKTSIFFFQKKLSDPFIINQNQNFTQFINGNNNNIISQKQNESHDIILQKNYITKSSALKIKNIFSISNIMNLLKRKSLNQKPTSVIDTKYNDKLNVSPLNKEDIDNSAQANTQREISRKTKNFTAYEKSFK